VDRVGIVTGAARGIGRATATRLAKDGHPLVLVDRDAAAVAAVAAAIEGAVAVDGDVRSDEVLDEAPAGAERRGSVACWSTTPASPVAPARSASRATRTGSS
jgi:NAD(P)-dependent dehydrogenase (short-subunit alcohol dehydrogenase family)